MFQSKFLLLALVTGLATAQYKIEPRIIQGRDAIRGQFPFYVYLQLLVLDGVTSCGGSLISDEWVVTAAHCLKNANQAIVHLGSLKAQDQSEFWFGRQIYRVNRENMYIYPKYSLLFFVWNDIGLIKLPKPVIFSDVIKPIPFACSSSSDDGVNVIAIGNGITRDNDNSVPNILQYTELKTISKLSCLKTFPYLMFRQSVVCVKGDEQRSICDGDSGGPLITSNNFLLGLSSFGRRTCQDGFAQVFTRISEYTEWIKEVSGVKCKN